MKNKKKNKKAKSGGEYEVELKETEYSIEEIDRQIEELERQVDEIREKETYRVVRKYYMVYIFIFLSIFMFAVSWIACRRESFKDVLIFWIIMEVWGAILMIPLYFAFRFREWRDSKKKKKGSK